MAYTFTPYGDIAGLLVVEGPAFRDERGYFLESFRSEDWSRQGLPAFVQDNLSRSRHGVIRGLHFQREPKAIGKLVRCTRGRIFDVAVDLRRGSPSYKKWASIELSDEGNRMFWVPSGFAHGFCALSEDADVSYKVTGYWSAEVDGGVRWNDPEIGVRWPDVPGGHVVSAKDAALPGLAGAGADFTWKG